MEERHYMRENKSMFVNRKALVLQERLFFRNIPLSNWVEHEMTLEEGGDMSRLAQATSIFMPKGLMGGGSGSGDSSHVVKGGGQDFTRTTGQVKRGDVEAPRSTVNVHQLKAEQIRAEVARREALKKAMQERIEANPKFKAMAGQILMELTPDGLRIQIVDADQRPMFTSGSAVVQSYMRELLRDLGTVLAEVPNRLTLEGHTDALPFGGGERGYSN